MEFNAYIPLLQIPQIPLSDENEFGTMFPDFKLLVRNILQLVDSDKKKAEQIAKRYYLPLQLLKFADPKKKEKYMQGKYMSKINKRFIITPENKRESPDLFLTQELIDDIKIAVPVLFHDSKPSLEKFKEWFDQQEKEPLFPRVSIFSTFFEEIFINYLKDKAKEKVGYDADDETLKTMFKDNKYDIEATINSISRLNIRHHGSTSQSTPGSTLGSTSRGTLGSTSRRTPGSTSMRDLSLRTPVSTLPKAALEKLWGVLYTEYPGIERKLVRRALSDRNNNMEETRRYLNDFVYSSGGQSYRKRKPRKPRKTRKPRKPRKYNYDYKLYK